jgi:hypothetical protein
MFDPHDLSKALARKADPSLASRRMRHVQPLRGLRGTPHGVVAELAARTWREAPPGVEDSEALHELFCTAHEDGLLALALVAALVPDSPHEVLDLAERWLDMVDDAETADALGWLVLGPALLAAGEPVGESLAGLKGHAQAAVRRTAIMAAMACLPTPVEGCAAAALRERFGRKLRFVEAPHSEQLRRVVEAFSGDKAPTVRKSLARVWRCWGQHDPAEAEAVLETVTNLPHFVREEAKRGIRKGKGSTSAGTPSKLSPDPQD